MSKYFEITDRVVRSVILSAAIVPLTEDGTIGRYLIYAATIILDCLSIILILRFKKRENQSYFKVLMSNWQSTVDDMVVFGLGGIICLAVGDVSAAIEWFVLCGIMLLCLIIPDPKK